MPDYVIDYTQLRSSAEAPPRTINWGKIVLFAVLGLVVGMSTLLFFLKHKKTPENKAEHQ